MGRIRTRSVVAGCLVLSLATSAGAQDFSDSSDAAGVGFTHQNPPSAMMMGGGMAWFDADADGDDDLLLTSSGNNSALLRNTFAWLDGAPGFDDDLDDDGLTNAEEVDLAAGSDCPDPVVSDSD